MENGNKEIEEFASSKNEAGEKEVEKTSCACSPKILSLVFGVVLILVVGSGWFYIKELQKVFKEESMENGRQEDFIKNKLSGCNENLKEKEDLVAILQQKKKSEQSSAQMIIKKRTIGDGCYKIINGYENVHGIVREDFNNDSADVTIPYTNKDFGISFNIPYNKNWGNEECVVLPYFSYGNLESWQVSFGQTTEARSFGFHTRQRRDKEDVLKEQKGNGEPDPSPRVEKIGEWEAVVYESYGMSTEKIYEIIGEKSNYIFSFHLVTDQSKESLATNSIEIIKIIKSFKKMN